MKRTLRIAVQVELNRAHGRALLEGIAAEALGHDDWRLEMVEPRILLDPAAAARFDGLVVRVMDDATERALVRAGRPAVDTYGRTDGAALPFIRLDDAALAATAAEFFAGRRYRDFAYCGFPGLRFSEARGEAFARRVAGLGGRCAIYEGPPAARAKETAVRRERIDAVPDAASLRRWIRSLPRPCAVFCCNDLRAYQVLRACADEGVAVPREAAVLGADNDTTVCAFAKPPLSSIDTDPAALGRTAARMLAALLSGRSGEVPRATLHGPRGIVGRTSTDAWSGCSPRVSDALVFVQRHLGEGINASSLAAALGVSHTTLDKAFRTELGTSPQREIARLRRELACRLLLGTDRSAADVAAECGYATAQRFSRDFASAFGTPPAAWRSRHRGAGGVQSRGAIGP